MKRQSKLTSVHFPAFCCKAIVAAALCQAVSTKAQLVNLGAAGNFGILETGNGNVSLAAAPPHGYDTGNVGVAGTGNLSDGGSLPINGNVYLSSGASSSGLSGNVSGSVNQNANLSAAVSAAAAASSQAAGLTTSGGGVGFTTINEGNNVVLNLNPGVYNLMDFKLQNGDLVNLTAGGAYVFNISGTMSLNSAQVIAAAGLSDMNVVFNVEGTQGVAFSGGLNQECVLDGVILAEDATVSLTPGAVNGEIISGMNINSASGGSVNAPTPTPIPEPSTIFSGLLLLLPLGVGAVRVLRQNRTA